MIDERRALGEAVTGDVTTRALGPEASRELLDAAEKHGLLGLFALDAEDFSRRVQASRARSLRALRFTRQVVDALDAAGVAHVVMKGAAAASRWPDPTLRQQSDVDVLVENNDLEAACSALISARVCSERFMSGEHTHNHSLAPAIAAGLTVEVHREFSIHHEAHTTVGELIARRVWLTTPQGRIPALSPEDDAVYLAMHASTHALERLAWIFDLHALDATVSWLEAARRARDWGVALGVAPAWVEAREIFATPIPTVAFEALRLPRMQWQLVRALLRGTRTFSGPAHRFFERSFRMSMAPVSAMPRIFVRKLRAGREEREGYAAH